MGHFLDHVNIEVRSGDGGNGIIAWRREKYEPMGGPAGGNGGGGGSVIFEATNDLSTLIDFRFKKLFEAERGERGGPKNQHGKCAKDLIIRVPVGTLIKDADAKEALGDLVRPGQRILVAEGGAGGRGNSMLASPTRRAPHFCEPGQKGVTRRLELELKVLADVGIIGLPNAGKSTLLSVISAAKPKIADYPFSTLEPNLGVVVTADGERAFVAADIPGLVEGASQGIGLGHDFLRHVERTRLLIHLVDMTSETLEKDIDTIDSELELYSEHLRNLPELLVLNKSDVLGAEQVEAVKSQLQNKGSGKKHPSPYVISAATTSGIAEFLHEVMSRLEELKPLHEEEPSPEILPPDARALDHGDTNYFEVVRRKKTFTVFGDKVERIVQVTNMRDTDSVHHLHYVLRSMGVIAALVQAGATPGSEVYIGESTFTFGEDW